MSYFITQAAAAARRDEMLAEASRWRAAKEAKRLAKMARQRRKRTAERPDAIDLREAPEILAAICHQ